MSLTSQIRYVRGLDSAATDGSGKTGLAFGDFTAKYLVEGGTLTSLTTETITTLGTYQAPSDAAHLRIKELSSSDPCKGVYEVHFHNTQVAATGKKLWLFLSASGAAFQPLELELLDTVTVGTNNDKTGYSLTQTFPANFADLAITVTTGRVTAGTVSDKTGYSLTSAYDPAKTASQAGDAMTLTSGERSAVADVTLRRHMASVEISPNGESLSVSSLYGIVQESQQANTTANAGKLTVFKTDGTTELAQKTLATDPAAEVITGIS